MITFSRSKIKDTKKQQKLKHGLERPVQGKSSISQNPNTLKISIYSTFFFFYQVFGNVVGSPTGDSDSYSGDVDIRGGEGPSDSTSGETGVGTK